MVSVLSVLDEQGATSCQFLYLAALTVVARAAARRARGRVRGIRATQLAASHHSPSDAAVRREESALPRDGRGEGERTRRRGRSCASAHAGTRQARAHALVAGGHAAYVYAARHDGEHTGIRPRRLRAHAVYGCGHHDFLLVRAAAVATRGRPPPAPATT